MQIEQALNSGFHIPKPGKKLNKAFLKVNPNRTQIEVFMEDLIKRLNGAKCGVNQKIRTYCYSGIHRG